MIDPRREREGGRVKTPPDPRKDASKQAHRSKTEGTNRDFDESGTSDNQAHGHPREERGRPGG
ncbi:MAG TPA: hypothetical protein VFZ24_10125 [Longimicrobiales bacterium]